MVPVRLQRQDTTTKTSALAASGSSATTRRPFKPRQNFDTDRSEISWFCWGQRHRASGLLIKNSIPPYDCITWGPATTTRLLAVLSSATP